MSPTIFRYKGYRFFFFSREEKRKHIHVYCSKGEAKFWLEPNIELANNYNLSDKKIKKLLNIIKENKDELSSCWEEHFRN